MKNSEKKKHIYLKNYPNVYRIFQKPLRFWYAKAIGSIILCIFMTIISIRLLHKGSIETAILFGFFTLLIGVTTLLYFLGKYQMLTSSDLTKLEKALQTLQKTVGNRFFFTESAIIILNDFSLCYYDCRKLKRIYFSDERERGNLYQNAVIHFVKKDGSEETISLRCDCSEFLRTIRTYYPKIQLPKIPLTFQPISESSWKRP